MASPPHKVRWLVFIGLACLALFVRLPRLGERPMHTDETINAYLTGEILAGQGYHYDPRDRHGPALCALTLPVVHIAGAHAFAELNESMLRLVPVIVGALTVLGFAFAADQIGFVSALLAATLFAFAPLPVYYSRYFIHETLFVAATFALVLCVWRFLALATAAAGGRRRGNLLVPAVAGGLFAGLMLACKETAPLHFAAMAAAAFIAWTRVRARSPSSACAVHWPWWVMISTAAALTFIFTVMIFFSWGGTHWQGVNDLLHSIPRFASRASGEGHEKPWWYYLLLLCNGWSGTIILVLALVGAMGIVWNELSAAPLKTTARRAAPQDFSHTDSILDGEKFQASQICRCFLLVYAVVISAFYSAIPYKTPWLALNLWLPISLLAGCAISRLWRVSHPGIQRSLFYGAIVLVIVLAGRDTWEYAFVKPADENNPYAYAHTSEDLLRLPERVRELGGSKLDLRIAVIAADPWPLPWYLRKFSQVGFWRPGQDPGPADIYITSPEAAEKLTLRLDHRRPEFFGARPEVLLILWAPEKEGSR